MSTNNGGPVFPLDVTDQGGDTEVHLGLMLRDYFAAKAMAAMIGTHGISCLYGLRGGEPQTAEAAYRIADAMLAERVKGPRADTEDE